MKLYISISRLPGERPNQSFMDKLTQRFSDRDKINEDHDRDQDHYWWSTLTKEQQQEYLHDHPHSALKVTK